MCVYKIKYIIYIGRFNIFYVNYVANSICRFAEVWMRVKDIMKL